MAQAPTFDTEINKAPALRISHVVRGRLKDGSRVQYLVDPEGKGVNAGVKLGHVAAQNWATLGLCGTRVMCGGQSCALPI